MYSIITGSKGEDLNNTNEFCNNHSSYKLLSAGDRTKWVKDQIKSGHKKERDRMIDI